MSDTQRPFAKRLRVWMLATGIGAVVAFAVFTIYRNFLPSGYITENSVAPGAYVVLAFWAILTVTLGAAWVVLLVSWLVRRRSL